MNRGGLNINYAEGFKLEEKGYKHYEKLLKYILNAKYLEASTRSLVDKATGIDCYAEIQGDVLGVSLRIRNRDYNSFTLNRHIEDKHSEIHKWIKPRGETIKPAYHIQIAPTPIGVKVWRINIEAFSLFLRRQINSNQLFSYYNDRMRCYEFTRKQVKDIAGVFVYELDNSYTLGG